MNVDLDSATVTPPTPRPVRAVIAAVLLIAAPVLAVATVLTQISYPLLDGEPLRLATITVVVLFCATSLAHAAAHLGPKAALTLLVVAGGLGLLAEAVGVRTGVPFGTYSYAGTLGPQVVQVPVIIPLAWTMMAYPCLLLGRRLAAALRERSAGWSAIPAIVPTALTGGLTLAAWDLFLDPQMVEAGHWRFADPTPGLPGVPGIPLTNYAGWLLVAVTITAALDVTIPSSDHLSPAALAVPTAMLTWTWLGSALANLAFFGRPAVAAWGLLGMGLTLVPYLLLLRQDVTRRRRHERGHGGPTPEPQTRAAAAGLSLTGGEGASG